MKSLSIVFAGTPEFTLPCLNAIAKSHHTLKAIYTQPDRPAGRGRKVQASAVKEWAVAHDLPVYQPLNFKSPDAITELASLQPDLIVVIAYGLILPRAVLELPRLGCINVHASLLPRWRGASPIQHAILHGDTQSGVTIMQMDAGMDTGPMLMQMTCDVMINDTAADLHDRLAELSAAPLLKTIDALASETAQPITQANHLATYASKINKADAAINWHQTAQDINQQIRAFNPWPIAYTHVNETVLRIYKAQPTSQHSEKPPGTIISMDKQGILVSTGQNSLLIERIQFPGGKTISVSEWLNSNRDLLYVGLVLQ